MILTSDLLGGTEEFTPGPTNRDLSLTHVAMGYNVGRLVRQDARDQHRLRLTAALQPTDGLLVVGRELRFLEETAAASRLQVEAFLHRRDGSDEDRSGIGIVGVNRLDTITRSHVTGDDLNGAMGLACDLSHRVDAVSVPRER